MAFFDRMEMTPEQLVEDADSIGRLIPAGKSEPVKRSIAHVLTYPPQEHKLGQGQEVLDRATGKSAGEVLELDRDRRTLRLKRAQALRSWRCPKR